MSPKQIEFSFNGNYSPQNIQIFRKAQEEDLEKICKFLGADKDQLKIKFQVFDTREGKQSADPNHSISRASARFDEMAIYRFWQKQDDPHFPHEITHLVAHKWGEPYSLDTELDTWDNQKIKRKIEMLSTSFMQEGLAIAVDDIVFKRKLNEKGQGKYIDDWCKENIDKTPKLSECINMEGFGKFENKIVVPFSASFSKFLILEFALEKYKQMYCQIKEINTVLENMQIVKNIYGLSEEELLTLWKQLLFASTSNGTI